MDQRSVYTRHAILFKLTEEKQTGLSNTKQVFAVAHAFLCICVHIHKNRKTTEDCYMFSNNKVKKINKNSL